MKVISSEQIAEMEKSYRTAMMNSISGYKPLNLLGTISEDGKPNLCVVSSVFHMGSNPPLLGMVIRPARPHNDSLKNIGSVKQYTLNNVQENFYVNAHQTSASYPSGVSEFKECGFNEYYLEDFKAPFVAESSVKIGLVPEQILDIDLNGTTIVIGKIQHLILDDAAVLPDGTIDHVGVSTVTGTGLDSYFLPGFLGRLPYAKPGLSLKAVTE
ncbi:MULTISPECIES: flavin reductase family protein [unclassified Mucilaginibacter]|uniref:flavin reductase family protein n=1 Tax=unclassified Mucilaginibacter TaxID=2617802 RepID=UPI000AB0D195|nr:MULTISPECIES: flavin reductase [unclassified Mucilaginibacter]PLW90889.1 MAG: flavin reductase [Mucilaginibacter sp.]HEK20493.1 flavin reductase family protein [Bacteroidota bacterium]